MAAMHRSKERRGGTAYSTAVGPSSRFRNDTRFLAIDFMTRGLEWERVGNQNQTETGRAGPPLQRRARSIQHSRSTQLPVAPEGGLIEEPTKEKVLLALEPRVVMAAMH